MRARTKRNLFYFNSGYIYKYIEIDTSFGYFFAVISDGFMRDVENIFREESNIPKIGEGWVCETELYYLIKNAFPNTKVIQHGHTEWLGKQHLDIFLPEYNIAIEYQGKQHFEPIEYFGGIESFNKTIARDKIKQDLCLKNGCELIYVTEDYEKSCIIQDISQKIRTKEML